MRAHTQKSKFDSPKIFDPISFVLSAVVSKQQNEVAGWSLSSEPSVVKLGISRRKTWEKLCPMRRPPRIQQRRTPDEQKRVGNEGTGTARSEPASQGSDEMDEQDDQIAHHRIVAGREIPTNYGRNDNFASHPSVQVNPRL
jgi:hypothetical protein